MGVAVQPLCVAGLIVQLASVYSAAQVFRFVEVMEGRLSSRGIISTKMQGVFSVTP
jgi:hypothetical protein